MVELHHLVLLRIQIFLQVPDDIIGITKVFHFDGSNRMASGMFSLKYQLFLNDVYFYGSTELLTYAMTKTYLEDINFLLTTQKQIRFNKGKIDCILILIGLVLLMESFL